MLQLYLSPLDKLREFADRPHGYDGSGPIFHISDVSKTQDLVVGVVHQGFVRYRVNLGHVVVVEFMGVEVFCKKYT